MAIEERDVFGQVLVALVTPMTHDGEVDWTEFKNFMLPHVTVSENEIQIGMK